MLKCPCGQVQEGAVWHALAPCDSHARKPLPCLSLPCTVSLAATALISCPFLSVSDPEARYIGTEPWKPKEALEEDGVITDKADIFAFGLTLWEMMTLSVPHVNLLMQDDDEEEGWLASFPLFTQSFLQGLALCRAAGSWGGGC